MSRWPAAHGADFPDAARARIFVVNIEDWEEIGSAHGEFFGNMRLAASMIESEAEAVLG